MVVCPRLCDGRGPRLDSSNPADKLGDSPQRTSSSQFARHIPAGARNSFTVNRNDERSKKGEAFLQSRSMHQGSRLVSSCLHYLVSGIDVAGSMKTTSPAAPATGNSSSNE
ncbi:hypothetical protein VTP01DRAFT_8247 [Rhizomucor pusillus]|uniref:uncharacterized protein n=1 Tax=Rhizomucor pusillus TaxID=4840 RepID=UPI00374491B4